MAEAAVVFLLENLRDLQLYRADLISDAKEQVESLYNDLRLFQAFLRDSSDKRRKDDFLREIVRQICDVVYEAEDIIDAFVTQAAESKSKNYFLRAFQTPAKLHRIAKDVENVAAKVKAISGDMRFDYVNWDAIYRELEEPKGSSDKILEQAPIVRQTNVVGFDDEARTLIRYLVEETEHLDVISIVGMPGLGKTTLASKIFHQPEIQFYFPISIWVYVSQEFTSRDIFLTILKKLTRLTEDMYERTDEELAYLTARHLQGNKFLIVMDDLWTIEDWEKLQVALPRSNNMGKVLITSRNEGMARHACRLRNPHKLRFLNQEESWLLLQLEVFGKPECPAELEVIGKQIAVQCEGLPLALVVLGGILIERTSREHNFIASREAWQKVCGSVSEYLNEDPQRRMERIISLSYDKLPFHLRACFLYFGMFPEDFEIPIWKLIRMWIAEGFIQQKDSISLEETAEDYLEDLISRKLVQIDKLKADGRVKTCRIHNMLRNFCNIKAGNETENFLKEIMKSSEGIFIPPMPELHKYRRLCIHSNISTFLSSKPFGPRVRSFVCFPKEDVDLPPENCSSIPAAFKLLRVLDVMPIKFTKIPSDLFQLVHLRYIAVSLHISVLPAAFSKLWNIQTLIVNTTSRSLQIRADIWRMFQLRYLKTNVSATLNTVGKVSDSKAGQKLHSLGTISPQNCTKEVFDMACNLKKLGIRGRLSFLFAGKAGSFDSLGRLTNLEKLKLLNDVFPSPSSEGKLHRLPAAYKFPPKLRSLTLAETFLDWSEISVLGLLQNLEILKLKNGAFMGMVWEAADGGFRSLEVLNIDRTDLAVWIAAGHHFPRLRRLQLRNCEKLVDVPIGLADIPTLEVLDVYQSKFAASSCKKIYEVVAHKTGKATALKLSIFPPTE